MPIVLVAALIVGAGVFLVFLGLAQSRREAGGSEDFQARLAQYGVGEAYVPSQRPAENVRERINRLFSPAAERVHRGDAKKGKPPLQEQLAKADLKLRTSEYFMIQLGFVLSFGLLAWLRLGTPIAGVVAGAVGYFIPGFYVKFRMRKRLKAFNNQLGDTLVLLSNALKAGYSFAQAIDTVAKNAASPMSDEFARAVREMNLGGSVDEALQNMVRRIDSPDFDLVVTAVAIHRTVGGNLAEILDNIAYTIRERIRIKGEIQTLTAQARASGWIITVLPIALATFMAFITPTYFRPMLENPVGWVMIGAGIFLIFIGNVLIRKVVQIEV
jgi:tight adherence protein B